MPRREPYFEDKNLTGYWKLDENVGSVVYDSSRFKNNGTVFGATWVNNKLNFDGIDDYVDIGNNKIFDITDKITIAGWIKLSNVNSEYDVFISKRFTAYELYPVNFGQGMQMVLNGVTFGDGNGFFNTGAGFNDLKYHYIAGVYTGTNVYLYVDGVQKYTTTTTGTLTINTSPVRIGERSTGSLPFSGIIDGVRIWNQTLSAAEIAKIYNNTKWKYK